MNRLLVLWTSSIDAGYCHVLSFVAAGQEQSFSTIVA